LFTFRDLDQDTNFEVISELTPKKEDFDLEFLKIMFIDLNKIRLGFLKSGVREN